jgi:hypothetical protein
MKGREGERQKGNGREETGRAGRGKEGEGQKGNGREETGRKGTGQIGGRVGLKYDRMGQGIQKDFSCIIHIRVSTA